jgi:hypothetical protein
MSDTELIGTMLYGFCNGYFGCGSYEDKIIEAVGVDWIVARDSTGHPVFAKFDRPDEVRDFIAQWSRTEE